jgi:hypothetical protein
MRAKLGTPARPVGMPAKLEQPEDLHLLARAELVAWRELAKEGRAFAETE